MARLLLLALAWLELGLDLPMGFGLAWGYRFDLDLGLGLRLNLGYGSNFGLGFGSGLRFGAALDCGSGLDFGFFFGFVPISVCIGCAFAANTSSEHQQSTFKHTPSVYDKGRLYRDYCPTTAPSMCFCKRICFFRIQLIAICAE